MMLFSPIYLMVKYFIQVNIAEEGQKSGVFLSDFKNFLMFCRKELKLDIIYFNNIIYPVYRNIYNYLYKIYVNNLQT